MEPPFIVHRTESGFPVEVFVNVMLLPWQIIVSLAVKDATTGIVP